MKTSYLSFRLLLIGCCLLPLWLFAQGPTSTENHIRTKVARIEAGTETAFNGLNSTDQSAVSISYVDGLGRPIQQIELAAPPDQSDVVVHVSCEVPLSKRNRKHS